MVTNIVDIFRQQAREHKTIKAFYYNRNYEIGSGREKHPLLWLEDPIYGSNQNNIFVNSLNFSILLIPQKDQGVSDLQNLAFSIGLNIIERIKRQNKEICIRPDWSFITLRDYYDNGSCGCRFSLNFTQTNMQDLCLIDEQFDIDNEFDETKIISDFNISPENNCETYTNKFPEFNLKTVK